MNQPAKILIVDDEYANIFLLENLLSNEYDICTAESGMDAYEKVDSFCPDLILLDIMMPEISGIDVCRKLHADPKYSNIPIIMVTAKSGDEDVREGLESGAVDYVTKPISEIELMARIRVALRLKKQREMLEEANVKILAANQEKDEIIHKLEDALREVKTLSGLLPVCANCKKIRDDKGYWNSLESYLGKNTDAKLTHGLCPSCKKDLYPELYSDDA